MDKGSEISPGRFTQKRVSRRTLLNSAVKLAVIGGLGATLGAVAIKEKDRILENEDKHFAEGLFRKPIEGEVIKQFVTDKYGDEDEIIVRDGPFPNDDKFGHTDPGQKVMARAVLGAQYDSYDPELGGPIMVNGEGYGKWYEISGDELVVYDAKQNKIDTHGKKLYMAGNFLRLPKENEADK